MSDGKKTLLPELLPEPRAQTGQGPRERVALRARAMLDRLSGLRTTAGAALLAVHCGGYGVVDPLPPPPAQCTSGGQLFDGLSASGGAGAADAGDREAIIDLTASTIGFQIHAVRVTMGGTLVRVEDLTQSTPVGRTDFRITILATDPAGVIEFEVDLGCGGAATTRHYRATPSGAYYQVALR